jgi:hypothetical protein
MAGVHQLILKEGIEEARRRAETKHERVLVEAAYQVLTEDAEKIGFTYSGFALTSLPHKPQSELVWRREGYNLTLLLESGRDRMGKAVGLPYGSYARFILLFLPICQGSCPAPQDDLSFSEGRDGGMSWPTRPSAVRRF